MSVDKLVDSTQLDADLTSVANAIRAKSGGSSQLAFPSGFVSEIGSISGGSGGIPIVVPSGYTQMEYIANDGTAYIDTGVLWAANKRIELSYCGYSSSAGYYNVFGNAGIFFQYANGNNNVGGKDVNVKINENGYTAVKLPVCPPHTLIITNTTIKVAPLYSVLDDEYTVFINSGSSVTTNTKSITIFCRHKEDDSVDYKAPGIRIYRWKVYENDTLAQELVPAMRDADSVLGMYDTVSGNFFTNAVNSGSFTGGAL